MLASSHPFKQPGPSIPLASPLSLKGFLGIPPPYSGTQGLDECSVVWTAMKTAHQPAGSSGAFKRFLPPRTDCGFMSQVFPRQFHVKRKLFLMHSHEQMGEQERNQHIQPTNFSPHELRHQINVSVRSGSSWVMKSDMGRKSVHGRALGAETVRSSGDRHACWAGGVGVQMWTGRGSLALQV